MSVASIDTLLSAASSLFAAIAAVAASVAIYQVREARVPNLHIELLIGRRPNPTGLRIVNGGGLATFPHFAAVVDGYYDHGALHPGSLALNERRDIALRIPAGPPPGPPRIALVTAQDLFRRVHVWTLSGDHHVVRSRFLHRRYPEIDEVIKRCYPSLDLHDLTDVGAEPIDLA
jgi:hypothetical protein